MSIETSIQNLADAINNLAAAYGGAAQETPQPGEAKSGRGRKATTATPAAASEPQASDDTGQPAPASTQEPAAAQGPAVVIDAGTGKQVIVEQPAAGQVSDEDWAAIKGKAAKLGAMTGGDEVLRAVFKDMLPVGAKQSVGSIREAGLQIAFGAAVEAKIASLEALAD